MNRMVRWYHKRRFITAYRILRNQAERHTAAGHDMHFIASSQAHFHLDCFDCPDLYL
jgi:hypothetical protein